MSVRSGNGSKRALPIEVRSLDEVGKEPWNAYVEAEPSATFFHRAEWRQILEEVFSHRAHFLCALQGSEITGVLPLARMKSRLFGDSLSSLPFCVYGGVVAHTAEARAALERAAEELALSLNVDYLEMRNRTRGRDDWPVKELYVTFRKELDPDPDKNLRAIPRKQRAMVRKGIKAGLTGEWENGVSRFYRIYATSVRNLGTPVFPIRYFEKLREVFGTACSVLTVSHEGMPISSVLSFHFKDEVLPYYGGGLPEARQLKGYDFLYWELMRRSCEQGARVFDYGRSKEGTGSFAFKKNWGFEPVPLPYQYRLVKVKHVPDVNPMNPKYRLFIELWKHLPLPIANSLGPLLSRSLG